MVWEDNFVEAIIQGEEDRVMDLVREKLDAGVPPDEILTACNEGMVELGECFARCDVFLPELMFGGMIMKSIMAELGPSLTAERTTSAGKVVMGSVQHDVHDIGKDIVVTMLQGTGFDVIDLGVDVAPAEFVEAIRKHQPLVVGMSVLLTTCFKSVIATIDAIKEAGLRDDVKVMVGGAAASELVAERSGCDFYGKTAVDGAKFAASVAGV